MIEFLGSLGPVTRLVVVGAGLLLGYLLAVELGPTPIVAGLIGGAVLSAHYDWSTPAAVGAGVLLGLVVWIVESLWKPNAPCAWCKGQPRRGLTSRGRWRGCFMCGGSGKRRPLGSKILRRNRRFLGVD